ncbi:MAG: GNAT family N-acetyltransferase [Gemmatimonadaceae bacterium]
MRIEPASPVDLADVRAAYAHGRAMQRDQGAIVWPEFGDAAMLGEIDAGHVFRVMVEDTVVGVFSVAYEDAAIWGSHERGTHLYLHRIARAAAFPGRGLMDAILTWAEERCRALGRVGLRLDTWADNIALIAFYQRRGFRLVGERRIGVDQRLPPHYHGNAFALLERSCDSRDSS